MKKFWRRVKPDPITEEIPTVFMLGEQIVEVGFTEWRSLDGGNSWQSPGPDYKATIPVSGQFDRIIFELPTGCFEWEFTSGAASVTIAACKPEEGRPLQRCYRYRRLHETEVTSDVAVMSGKSRSTS